MKLTIYTLGGAHYTDPDESTRVLPSRRRTFRLGLYERMHRSYRLSRYALQAAQGQYEQRGLGSVLSRSRNSPFSVSIAFMGFCSSIVDLIDLDVSYIQNPASSYQATDHLTERWIPGYCRSERLPCIHLFA